MPELVLDKPRLVPDKPTDLGMIAIRRKKLPGVWDYDKQLEALLGDPKRPIEDFIPWDIKYKFGRVVGMTTKPDETKDKMTMSLVYSVLFNESTAKTYGLIDELNKVAFHKQIPVERALKEYSDYYKGAKNYVGAIKHGLRRANIMAQKQIGGLAKMVGEFIEPQERVRPLFPALNEWEKNNADTLKKWGDMILADVEDYYRENKAEAIQILPGIGYWKTLNQYITNPVNLVQGIVESGPLMLEGMLGITIGGPAGGIALMAVPIWGDVYADARADGTEPLPAMAEAILTGTGEAAIEQWTLGRKLGLMRNYRKIVADGLPKVLWEGTKAFFRGTAEEGSQEFNRNFWRWVFTDRSQQWSENVKESMAAGGPMEMVMAGGFSAAGAMGPVVPKEQQIERLDKIQESIEAEPTLTEEHKAEIRRELDIVRKDIGEDVYISEEEVEKPVAAKKPAEVVEIPPEAAEAKAEAKVSKVMPEHEYAAPGIIQINSTIGEIRVPEVDLTGEYGDDLETIFYYGNKQSEQVEQPNLKRSLSVGDVIRYRDHLFLVDHTGWKDITGRSEEELKAILGSENLLKVPTVSQLAKEKPDVKKITEAKPKAVEVAKEEEKALLGKIAAQIRAAESALEEFAVPEKELSFEERAKIAQIRHVLDELKTAVREEKLAKPKAVEVAKVVIPESEKEWAKRAKAVKKELEKEIESTDVYRDEITAQAERAEKFQVGIIYFDKKYKGEVTEAIESHPSLRFHITYDKTKGAPWDGIIQERLGRYLEGVEATGAYMDVSEFLEAVAEVTEHRKKIGKLNLRALEALAESGDIYFETLAAKYDMMQQGLTAEEMNENIREIALDYPEVPSDYVEKLLIPIVEGEPSVEAKQRMVEEVEEKARPLRQKIHAIAAQKGLTKTALSDLKLKHTGYRKLTGKITKKKITLKQLQSLLRAVQKARPVRVGYKKVITKKTEKKIQSLKENLIKKTQMTERHFDKILEIEIQGREPKYIDAKKFITETQGKDIIKRMLDTAEIVRLTESFEQAIAKNPEIADRVKLLDSRIEKAPKRDPYSLESMRYYNQQAQIKTGAPIFTSYMDLMDTHLEAIKTRTATWKRFEKTSPKFKEIAKDEAALQRVSDYIASQSTLKEKPAVPEDITTGEKKLAKEIQKILKEYRLKVRVTKFYNWYYYKQPIPDQDRYVTEITKATDIYESKGKEELIEYLDTQEWGVIKSGYEPLEIMFHKIRPYTTGPTAVGKGHIKIRTDIEYHRQERNILQRLSSYMRQIDMLYNLSPKINAYVRLFDDNAGKFSDWGKVKNDIEIFLRNLKRYNIEGGFFQRVLSRAYSQAMRVIIMPSPVLSFRNLFQNLAFEHDKSILIDPRNTKLSSSDIEYLETYILQTRAMVEEYFMVGEKPLPMLKTLTKMIDKVKIYPYSDIANRHWSFWAKTNQVDRALKADTTKQMMTEAKFEDMKELEQRRALAILARDGKEAMTQYVGRVHVDDIHFLYERSQRSPAEMTSLGKIVGNLMLFPRAYGEKLAHATNKALKGKTYEEQWRGMKTLFAVIGGGMIAGSIYMKITGRKRNPYNPLEVLAFRPGGLAWGSIEAATEIYANILSAAKGDSRALAALTVAIPRAADMFIPFYDYSLRAIEAATDQKNIDRKALRQMRMMIDKEYKIRGGAYKVKRNALEKWQYFLSGPSAEKEKKVSKPKAITW